MDFFISNAYAAGNGASTQGNPMSSLVILVLMLVVFYFLLIRPQTKRAKEHRNLVAGLQKGDEVITNGGIAGVIAKVGESFTEIEIAENIKVKIQKSAIASVLPKGTLKSS